MQFRAGTARAGLTHHPEIVFSIAWHDVNLRVESNFYEMLAPKDRGIHIGPSERSSFWRLLPLNFVTIHPASSKECCLINSVHPFVLIRAKNRCVNPLFRESPNLGHQFPGPVDRFLLEIIPERPVAEHFEKSVVICVQPHVFEIVMLASGTDAFLGIRRAGIAPGNDACPFTHVRLLLAEKNRHELVHACVRKYSRPVRRGVVQTRRRHDGVALRIEEIQERLTYFSTGHTKSSILPKIGRNLPSGRTKKISTTRSQRREKNARGSSVSSLKF